MSDETDGVTEKSPTPPEDVTEESSTPETADADGGREASESDEDTAEKAEKPRKRGASQRIGELVSLNKAKDAEIERLMRLVESGRTPQQAAGSEKSDDEPKRDAYDDYEAFIEDRARWVARQEFREQSQKHEEETRRERESRMAAELQQRWESSYAKALDSYDDYEDIFDQVGTAITVEHAGAIRNADEPAEVVYFLGKNPKELEKFSKLQGAQLFRAVGRLEERIAIQREQQSKAPKPVSPVRGSQPSPNRLRDDMPISEWMKLRNKQARGG